MGHDIVVGELKTYITFNYHKLDSFLFSIYDMHGNTSNIVAIMCYCNMKWLEKYWGIAPPSKTLEQLEFISSEKQFYDPDWMKKYFDICKIPYDKKNNNYYWGCYSSGEKLPFGIFLESYYNNMLDFCLFAKKDISFSKPGNVWKSDQAHNQNPIKNQEQLLEQIKSKQGKCIAYSYVYSYLNHPDGKYTIKKLKNMESFQKEIRTN